MRVVVTGASGVFGRAVTAHLVDRGHEVVGFSRRPPAHLPAGASHVAADVSDAGAVASAVDGCDAVAHCAWVVDTLADKAREEAINVGGSANVLRAAEKAGARVVFASSVTAYGPRDPLGPECGEDDELAAHPDHPYAVHKVRVEAMCAQAGVETVSVRAATVLGRRIDNRILAGFLPPAMPVVKGRPSRFQVVHHDDVGRFLARACEGGPTGPVNLAAPGTLSFAEIASLVGRRTVAVSERTLGRAAGFLFRRGLIDVSPAEFEEMLAMPVAATTRLEREWGFRCAFDGRETVADTRLAVEPRVMLGRRVLDVPGRLAFAPETDDVAVPSRWATVAARTRGLDADVRLLARECERAASLAASAGDADPARAVSVRALAADLAAHARRLERWAALVGGPRAGAAGRAAAEAAARMDALAA